MAKHTDADDLKEKGFAVIQRRYCAPLAYKRVLIVFVVFDTTRFSENSNFGSIVFREVLINGSCPHEAISKTKDTISQIYLVLVVKAIYGGILCSS